MPSLSQISTLVRQAASDAGFDLAGMAAVEDFPELAHFPGWVESGRAGEMDYLKKKDQQGRLQRASLQNAVPWARSVIVCAMNYNTAQPSSTDCNESDRGWISRYAWSDQDYHDAVLRRLRQVEGSLRNFARDTDLLTRCYVDTGPIVERVYAKYAGIGWIGKNTCIINQQLGSWLFLGVILTSLPLVPAPASPPPTAAVPARAALMPAPPVLWSRPIKWIRTSASLISPSKSAALFPKLCAPLLAAMSLAATSARTSVPGIEATIRRSLQPLPNFRPGLNW